MTEAAMQDSDGKQNYPLRIGCIIKIFIYWQRLAVSPVIRFQGLFLEHSCTDETNFLFNNVFSTRVFNGGKKSVLVMLWNTPTYTIAGNIWDVKPKRIHSCILCYGHSAPH